VKLEYLIDDTTHEKSGIAPEEKYGLSCNVGLLANCGRDVLALSLGAGIITRESVPSARFYTTKTHLGHRNLTIKVDLS
jgi:hypothetical protein